MDLGYADHVRQMLQCVRPDRQMILFARDMDPFVQELCSTHCRDVVEVHVGVPDRVTEVNQMFELVTDEGAKRKKYGRPPQLRSTSLLSRARYSIGHRKGAIPKKGEPDVFMIRVVRARQLARTPQPHWTDAGEQSCKCKTSAGTRNPPAMIHRTESGAKAVENRFW